MSIHVMNRVWQESAAKGAALLLLLALADHSDDEGRCYPSITALAKKIRMSERHTQNLLRALEGTGEVHTDPGGGRHMVNVYQVDPGGKGEIFSVKSSTEKGEPQYRKGEMGTPKRVNPSSPGIISNRQRTIKEPSGGACPCGQRHKAGFKPLTQEQRKKILAEYGDVSEEIDRALNHEAHTKNLDMNLYVRGWLRRDLERRNGNARNQRNGKAGPELSRSGLSMESGRLFVG